jgi:uncharacterized protein DUF2188
MYDGRWYFRVVEQNDGTWMCRRGRYAIDHHPDMQQALDHIKSLASNHRPSEVRLHHLNGRVETVITFE